MEFALREESYRTVRYICIGFTAFLIDMGVFLYLWKTLEVNSVISFGISAAVAYGVNFLGHKFFTFRDPSVVVIPRQLILHGTMKTGNILLRMGILYLVERVLKMPITVFISLSIVIGISVWSFLATRWIFAHSSPYALFLGLRKSLRSLLS